MAKSNTARDGVLAIGVGMAVTAGSQPAPPPDAALLRGLPAGSASDEVCTNPNGLQLKLRALSWRRPIVP